MSHYTNLYISAQSVGLRALVVGKRLALAPLLQDFENKASVLRVDPSEPRRDRHDLMTKTTRIRTWTNKVVAHVSEERSASPTFEDLDEAIDLAGHVFQRYGGLVLGTDFDLTPLPSPRWREVFYEPLFDHPPWHRGP